MTASLKKLEIHRHSFISGPVMSFSHSHAGGDHPHQHDGVGPASYTIDKDEWRMATGLRGGGKKKYSARPSGPQLEIRDLEEWQKSFKVVICQPPKKYVGEGPGVVAAARLTLGAKMESRLVDKSRAARQELGL